MIGAMDAGAISSEAVELAEEVFVQDKLEGIRFECANGGLHVLDAEKIPGGEDQFAEHSFLDGALGADVCAIFGDELFELFALLVAEVEVFGGKSVGARVLRRARLARIGARTGAMPRVGDVCKLTGGGRGRSHFRVLLVA
jgi:hypothetical protein